MSIRKQTVFLGTSFREWAYNMSGFGKYGLMRDDVLNETPDVVEALRRLPRHIHNERAFRIMRAMLLSANKRILPEDQQTKYSDDIRYLKPYLDEVVKERKEKEAWENE